MPRLRTDTDRALRLSTAIEAAQDCATKSLSAATRRDYNNDWQHSVTWCDSVDQSALPASPITVAAFISGEAKRRGHTISTLHRRLAAIGVAHRQHGLPSPHQDPLCNV